MRDLKFYLEANAIRNLSSNLEFISGSNCFTSMLTLNELLSGIKSESEFIIRKGILKSTYVSKIYVDFDSPIDKFLNSFGVPFKLDFESEYIKIIEALLSAESYSDFTTTANKNHKTAWDFIKKLDTELSTVLKKAFKGKYQDFKDTYDVAHTRTLSENWWSNFSTSRIDEYVLELRERHALSISRTPELNLEGKSFEELNNSYNNSIDTAILFASFYRDNKILWGNEIGKNDNADLGHLFYLNDLSTVIVTDDKLLNRMFKKLMPERILKCQEFMNQTHSN